MQDTRLTQLVLRPNVRSSWIGLAVTLQMTGNLGLAIDVLDAHQQSMEVRLLTPRPTRARAQLPRCVRVRCGTVGPDHGTSA